MSDHHHVSALEPDTSPKPPLSAVIARACVAALVIVSSGFVTLMIIGVIRFWHPLPHWDMWGGYVAFWLRLTDGDWSTFWELHNEHRIVLTRLVFWVDFAVFKGAGWFLLASSAALALAIAATFFAALHWRLLEARGAIQPIVGFALLVTLTIAW